MDMFSWNSMASICMGRMGPPYMAKLAQKQANYDFGSYRVIVSNDRECVFLVAIVPTKG